MMLGTQSEHYLVSKCKQLLDGSFDVSDGSWKCEPCAFGLFSSILRISFMHENTSSAETLTGNSCGLIKHGTSFICKIRRSLPENGQENNQQLLSLKIQQFLSPKGISPSILHYEASTGLEIQEYVGRPLQSQSFDHWPKVGKLLAVLHCHLRLFHKENEQDVPLLWTDPEYQQRRVRTTLLKIQNSIAKDYELIPNFDWLTTELAARGAEQSLCHNDFYPNNILVNDQSGELSVIDFDMISMHWRGYDVASFFYTQCRQQFKDGSVALKLSNLPNSRLRREFVRNYFDHLSKLDCEVLYDEEVFQRLVDLLICYGWLFSAVTRFEGFLLLGTQDLVDEIRTRLRFHFFMTAKWSLEQSLLELYFKKKKIVLETTG